MLLLRLEGAELTWVRPSQALKEAGKTSSTVLYLRDGREGRREGRHGLCSPSLLEERRFCTAAEGQP